MEQRTTTLTDPDSARGKLLQAAAELFRTKGYDRTTVRDIANAVGILSGSIFHHFKTKDDILGAVMEESVNSLLVRMESALATIDTPVARLRAMIRCELESIQGENGHALAVLVYEWRSLSPENQQNLLHIREAYEQLWLTEFTGTTEHLKPGIEPFVLRRFLSGSLYWTTYWYKESGALTISDLTEMALKLILK